ncbi:kinase-like domain-containing protein [Rhizoctonia solani]|nr:kinase-like domain-containing protein [Rhizoctonia solani]
MLRSTSDRLIHVALKRLRKEKRMYKHICYELYTWSKTSHQNVLELLGIAWFKNRLVMISPWMEHGNIEDYVHNNPTVDRLTLVSASSGRIRGPILIGSSWSMKSLQVVHGVNYLHKVPLIHGDLKARNIFVSGDGVVKVGDFGLAKLLGEQSLRFSASGTQSFGTIRWTAPELFEAQPHRGLASDIYALGMTLLEIVTGRVPFHELISVREVMAAVLLRGERPRMTWEVREMGRHGSNLWAVLNACWDRVPERRPSANLISEWVYLAFLSSLTNRN